jgi:transcription antitermination factor NusG
MTANWYIVYCNVKCEARASEGLRKKGFAVYHPTRKEERQVRRTKLKRTVTLSLFPRYIFVEDGDAFDWHKLRNTDGVESFLASNGAPATVAGHIIEELQLAQDCGLFDKTSSGRPTFTKGQQVKIINGAGDGIFATIERSFPNGTARVLMTMFGGQSYAKVSVDDLRLVA